MATLPENQSGAGERVTRTAPAQVYRPCPELIESPKQPGDGTPGIVDHFSCECPGVQQAGYGVAASLRKSLSAASLENPCVMPAVTSLDA